MLYNQNWNEKPQRDIWSLDSLISWLETKDPKARYDYCHSGKCLLAQYLTAMGLTDVSVSPNWIYYGPRTDKTLRRLPDGWNDIALPNELGLQTKTFGAALRDAKQKATVTA